VVEAASLLDPSPNAKPQNHSSGDRRRHHPEDRISPLPIQLGEMAKVHSIDAGEESKGDEDGADDRQYLDDLVHAIAHGCHVRLGEPDGQLAVGLDDVDHLNRMLVDVADVSASDLRQTLVRFAVESRWDRFL